MTTALFHTPTSAGSDHSGTGLPAWAVWHCANDDTFWKPAEGDNCWFCGEPGTPAHPPQLNSQHGADHELADRERLLSQPAT